MLGILLLAGFAYFSFINTHNSFINHDFYRVLYEASNTLNENLNSLERMHAAKESEVSIRSLLPSYRRSKKSQIDDEHADDSYGYELDGHRIKITAKTFTAILEVNDILSETKQGFSQYLFADHNGQLLANTGGEKTISIVDLSSINNQILQKSQPFAMPLNDKGASDDDQNAPLPSYSSHVDMQLSYGEFRIFIFPFSLSTQLHVNNSENKAIPYMLRLALTSCLSSEPAS